MKVYPLEDYQINDLIKKNFYLCNFYERPMEFRGRKFGNAEAAYQAEKCLYDEDKDLFTIDGPYSAPRDARDAGQEVALVPNWDDVRIVVMYQVIREKFLQHPDLALRLKNTGNALITEGDRFRDTFWGLTKEGGENHLGNIIMYIRDNDLLDQGQFNF